MVYFVTYSVHTTCMQNFPSLIKLGVAGISYGDKFREGTIKFKKKTRT